MAELEAVAKDVNETVKDGPVFTGFKPLHSSSGETVGAYVIRHVETGAFYVGSSTDLYKRRNRHINDLKNGVHFNERLQEVSSISSEFELEFHPVDLLDKNQSAAVRAKEQELLDQFKGNPLLCNVARDAIAPNKGIQLSAETKAKMGASWSDERRAGYAEFRKETPLSADHRTKIAAANSGHEVSPETRQKLSEKHKALHQQPEVIERMRSVRAKQARPVVVQGVRYESLQAAGDSLGIDKSLVRQRCLNDNKPDWYFDQPD